MTQRIRFPSPLLSTGRDMLDVSIEATEDVTSAYDKWSIEPGLLAAFRMLMAIPLVVGTLALIVNLSVRLIHPEPGFVPPIPRGPVVIFMISQALTLAYLCVPCLQKRLGIMFLPIALVLATMGEILLYSTVTLGDFSRYAVDEVMNKGGGSLYFLIIPLVLIGWQYGFRAAGRYTGMLVVFELIMVAVSMWQGHGDAWLRLESTVQRTVIFLVVAYLVTRVIMSQRKQREALHEANIRLQEYNNTLEQLAVSRERNRLARELHDTLAHHMSGMILQLEGTKLLWEQNLEQAKTTLEKSIETARSGLIETRRALQALRATPLEDMGLRESVRLLATNTAERAGLELDLSLPSQSLQLPPAVEQTVYRITQEALTNIERHANAETVSVLLGHQKGEIHLQIADDGCGFANDELHAELRKRDLFGLRGMHERAAAVNGELTIQSEPARGTVVEFHLELP